MIKKRLIGVVTVKQGRAVQSFGYKRYFPLGRPEVLIENLDRWGADEILLQCIDRSRGQSGPDFGLLEKASKKGLSTPLIYSGGIRTVEDGIAAIKAGADRICVDALLHDAPQLAVALAEALGAQAIIAALPLAVESQGLRWLDYRTGRESAVSPAVLEILQTGILSEALIIDWRHEGTPGGFDLRLLSDFPLKRVPLIAFGGISEPTQLRDVLQMPTTVAAAVGNFLSYREHAIQFYKESLVGLPLRTASYASSELK